MVAGQCKESSMALCEATYVLRQIISEGSMPELLNPSSMPTADQLLSTASLVQVHGEAIAWDANPSFVNGAMFPLFDRALSIKIHDTASAQDLLNLDFVRRLAAVVLYNKGLLCHCQALQKGDSREMYKALSYYQAAMGSILSAHDHLKYTAPILVLALLNNMGHIRCHHHDRDEARTCLDMLRHIFDESGAEEFLEEEDSLFFYFTIFTTCPNDALAIAPAA